LTAGLTAAQIAAGEAALPTLGGSLTAGLTAADIAALEAGLPTSGSLTAGMTIADIVAAEAGLPGAGFGAASLLGGAVPTGGVPPVVPTTGVPPPTFNTTNPCVLAVALCVSSYTKLPVAETS
jgi:hypothetical protein